jgi:hypothetical protein
MQLLGKVSDFGVVGGFSSALVVNVLNADPDFSKELLERGNKLVVGRLRSDIGIGLTLVSAVVVYLGESLIDKGLSGEPTSGLEPLSCSLRVIGHVLQGFA